MKNSVLAMHRVQLFARSCAISPRALAVGVFRLLVISALWVSIANAQSRQDFFAIDVQTGQTYRMQELAGIYQDLRSRQRQSRRQFESLNAFDARVARAAEQMDEFTARLFDSTFVPDQVDLDWENSALVISTALPLPIMRQRGGPDSSTMLTLRANVDERTARTASMFSEKITVDARFNINRHGMIVIHSITARHIDEVLYQE